MRIRFFPPTRNHYRNNRLSFEDMTKIYPYSFGTLDEYLRATYSDARYHTETSGIIHSGNEVKMRHFEYLKRELNLLLPTVSFNVYI
jgi:hypothetical protein